MTPAGAKSSATRILLVDDHENMRVLLGAGLRASGYTDLREAGDGEAAWALLLDYRPHLVVTDFSMPKLDGIAFTRRLRAQEDEALAATPVILVTGHAHETHILAAKEAGVNEFMAKPVVAANLAQRVRRWVREGV